MDSTLAAGYDGFDLRAWKIDSAGTTYYLYDDDGTSPVCELSSSGAVAATNTYTVNGLASRHTSTGSTFYEFDPQGSVSARLNSAGTCTSSSITDGFGTVANSATVSDPFGYEAQAGYVTDTATGLILTTFRYYDPSNGRFLNRDPIGYDGGVDQYAYVGNDAGNLADPTGTITGLDPGSSCSPPIIETGPGFDPSTPIFRKGRLEGGRVVTGCPLTPEQALRHVLGGGDIVAPNRGCAKGLGEKGSPGGRVIGPEQSGNGQPGYWPHYHPGPRNGSHIWYPPDLNLRRYNV